MTGQLNGGAKAGNASSHDKEINFNGPRHQA
jgi:hypothetical protein